MSAETLPTERIRFFYTHATAWAAYSDAERPDLVHMRETQAAEFDRWLAEHDAQVWAEGHKVGWEHCQDGNYGNDYWDDDTPNPYRTVADTPAADEGERTGR